jgi:hypothetical protein
MSNKIDTGTVWHCECHPRAQWGHFATYEGCPISDLYYADPASTTYGKQYPSVAELVADHPTARA